MIDMIVPQILIELAMTVCVIERFARGKRVTRAKKNVPAIAMTRGRMLLAFPTGWSRMKNRIVISAKKQTMEDRDTRSTRNFPDAGSFPE
jgi:hypothetical protein